MSSYSQLLAEYKIAYGNLFQNYLKAKDYNEGEVKGLIRERERALLINDEIFQEDSLDYAHCTVMKHLLSLELYILKTRLEVLEAVYGEN